MSSKEKKLDKKDIFRLESTIKDANKVLSLKLKEIDDIKEKCLYVLDTNVLLVPYKLIKENLEVIIFALATLASEERLTIPGRVVREFALKRADQIKEIHTNLTQNRNKPDFIQKLDYPIIQSLEGFNEVEICRRTINEGIKNYQKAIDDLIANIQKWKWNDPVSIVYSRIFTTNVIYDPEFDREKIREELEWRQNNKIPPGYKDSGKDDKGIGDFLIWKTILKLGKTKNLDIIFVSNDVKPDWWYQSNKIPLYPRYELVYEFWEQSNGRSFHIIRFSEFLKLVGIPRAIIDEVKQHERSHYEFAIPKTVLGIKVEQAVQEYLINSDAIIDVSPLVNPTSPYTFSCLFDDESSGLIVVKFIETGVVAKLQLKATLFNIIQRGIDFVEDTSTPLMFFFVLQNLPSYKRVLTALATIFSKFEEYSPLTITLAIFEDNNELLILKQFYNPEIL